MDLLPKRRVQGPSTKSEDTQVDPLNILLTSFIQHEEVASAISLNSHWNPNLNPNDSFGRRPRYCELFRTSTTTRRASVNTHRKLQHFQFIHPPLLFTSALHSCNPDQWSVYHPSLTNTKRSLPTNITFATGQPPATLTDRFVQQHHPSFQSQARGHHRPNQQPSSGQHRRLRKYASETSFASAVDIPAAAATSNSDETPSPPIPFSPLEPLLDGHLEEEEGTKSGRPTPTKCSINATAGGINGGNVANKINKLQRRRQDSDENGSGSVGSETTVASGTMTPQSRRNMRFKMRRPKSTGNMISGGQVVGGPPTGTNHVHYHQQTTIHSLDDSIQQPPMQGETEERRPSNFYLFEDDSNHEFDDEVNG
uniref:Uncharacterized protein n=1 Tax=Ditylenchus dipsaci TaxID=166011 RepID=A0A915DVQ0_9BILA